MKTKSILFYLMFAFCTNSCITAYAQAVNKQDSLALVDLYNSTNGAAWSNNENWLTGPVATWYGISVTDTRVTGISLSLNDLRGNLPSSLGNIANLFYLFLGNNQLSGSIPFSFGNLLNLDALALFNNQLSGSIPSSLGNLVNLTSLSFSNNQLSGSIPSSLGNLVNLNSLSFSNNQLSGNIPSSVGNLLYLEHVDLSYNQLSGRIPSSLGNLINVDYLDLSFNQLSESIPSSLGKLLNLQWLDLSDNRLSGNIPSSLGNLSSLYYGIDLSNNQLSGRIPASLSNLVNIFSLSLTHNNFTFDGMELIAKKLPFAIYSTQARIPVHQNGNALSVSAGGTLSNNTYKWFRCGKTGNTLVATIAGDSVFHPSQSGLYLVKVTNSVAKQLTLYSNKFTYTAPSKLTEFATASSESAMQNAKTNIFLAYPNPAKSILNLKTNGNTVVSLIDQSGKIILTKTIEGSGAINVTALPAGLYYLKNDATGETRKIIVIK